MICSRALIFKYGKGIIYSYLIICRVLENEGKTKISVLTSRLAIVLSDHGTLGFKIHMLIINESRHVLICHDILSSFFQMLACICGAWLPSVVPSFAQHIHNSQRRASR